MKPPPVSLPIILRLLLLCWLSSSTSSVAQFPGASWESLSDAEAASAGWSKAKLKEAEAFSKTMDTEAVMMVTRGKVLTSWGAVDQKFNIHSIRKSFLSAMCGIQVTAGKLKLSSTMGELGIDDNEPSLSEVEKKATVLQLLQARSGVYHPALYETKKMKERRPQRHSHAPGTFWYYNNWDFNVLGTIYEGRTGRSIYEDLERLVAEPIGMQDYEASDGTYFTGPDSIHRAYPLRMTARDLARFGLLFLHSGQWNGVQVIPQAWVKDSVTSYSDAGTSGGYGYLWWITRNGIHFPGVTLPEGSYSARGSGGHYILVIPPLDLVIVHRVNTDLSERHVEAPQFGELVQRVLLAYEFPKVQASQPETSYEGEPRGLDTTLSLLMSKYRVPGAAVIGIANGRVAWEKYLGTREAGKAAQVDENTAFEAASMTKPLAAYAALKLVEQGKLDLDKPLASYLPEPYLKDEPLHEKITARMVLSHSSGFPNWRPEGEPLKVMHEPGTQFVYSGEGFLFLQEVIAQITGEDYESYLQRTLMQPLGMKHSSHVWKASYAESAAAGHDDEGKVKPDRRLYTKANAAYTLYCTPRDYASFVMEMLNPDRSAAHSLSKDSLSAMLTCTSPASPEQGASSTGTPKPDDKRYGLGWAIRSSASGDRINHGGATSTGFRSYVEFDPEKGNGIIIMANSTGGDEMLREFMDLIGTP